MHYIITLTLGKEKIRTQTALIFIFPTNIKILGKISYGFGNFTLTALSS